MLLLNFPTPESFIAEHQDQEASCDSLSYNGNCHCGRFRFRLMHPRIWCAFMCTCSLCEKQGGLWLVPEPSSFEITRDEGALVSYTTPLTTSQVRRVKKLNCVFVSTYYTKGSWSTG